MKCFIKLIIYADFPLCLNNYIYNLIRISVSEEEKNEICFESKKYLQLNTIAIQHLQCIRYSIYGSVRFYL